MVSELPTSLVADPPEIPPHAPILDNLYGVGGVQKPLGYLTLGNIRQKQEYPEAVIKLSERRGMSTYVQDKKTLTNHSYEVPHFIGDGQYGDMAQLYVYDSAALSYVLEQNKRLLEKRKWPASPDEFVKRVGIEAVDLNKDPALHELIARCFGDERIDPVTGEFRPTDLQLSQRRSLASVLGGVAAKLIGR